MDINKKTRVELKNYFKKNAIPTEGNFADFIDAGVNQKDDGLLKPAGEPLSLEAAIDGAKTAIRFYETFAGNTNPSWVVSLVEPVSKQSAFVLSDALGNTRLWIGQSGVVTVPGTVSAATLTVSGTTTAVSINASGPVTAGGLISGNGGITVPSGKTLTVNGTLTAGTMTATGLTVNGNISITGGGALTAGTINASGLITANVGLTVPIGQPLSAGGTLTVIGTTTTNTLNANGTINANAGLTVNGTLNVAGSLGELGFLRRNLGGAPAAVAGDRYTWYNPDGVARLWTPGNGDLLTIRKDGFVGFGTSDPQFRLDVVGRVRLHPDPGASAGMWLTGEASSASGARTFIGLKDDLNVGFYGNTGTPGWRLFVNTTTGDLTTTGSLITKGVVAATGNLTVTGSLTVTGGAVKPGGGPWGVFSDARLKQNIEPLHNALERLLQLRGATFEWREPEKQGNLTGPQIGFIGQEVEKVFPEWIMESDDGYKLLSIRGFEALAVEALRELRAENQALKQSYQELQAEIAGLAARSQTTGEAP